MLDLEIS